MCAKVAAAQPATAEQSAAHRGGASGGPSREVEFAWMANESRQRTVAASLPDVLTYHVPGQQLQTD